MKKEHFKILMYAGLLYAVPLTGQETQVSDSAKKLNEVVISATREEKLLEESGRSITVISKEKIADYGVGTLTELLALVEGINMVGQGQNPGSIGNMFIRGANNNHSIIMIDGVRVTDASTVNNSIDLSELSLANIERIEIVRGSHGTAYGSGAIGGVVNIVTRKGGEKEGLNANLDFRGGLFNPDGKVVSENLFLGYRHKSGFYAQLAGFNMNARGFNSTLDTVTNPNAFKHKDQSDPSRINDLMGKIGFMKNNIDGFVSIKSTGQETQIDDGAFRDDDNHLVNFKRLLVSSNLKYTLKDRFVFRYIGGISTTNRNVTDDSSKIDNNGNFDGFYINSDFSGKTSTHEFQVSGKGKHLEGLAGFGYYSESMEGKVSGKSMWGSFTFDSLSAEQSSLNLFFNATLKGSLFGEKLAPLSLFVGARMVDHEVFGKANVMELTPSWKFSNGLLYFSWSTGFNAPSLYQLYSPEKDFFSGITRGNPGLGAETSSTLEVGLKQKSSEAFSWSASVFQTKVDNVIEYVYLWDGSKNPDSLNFMDYRGDTYVNLGTMTTRGVEFSFSAALSEKVRFLGNVSLIQGSLDYEPGNSDTSHIKSSQVQLFNSGFFPGKRKANFPGLTRRPSHANLSLIWIPIERLKVIPSVRFVSATTDVFYDVTLLPFGALGRMPVNDYILANLLLSYEFKKIVSLSLKCENLFDTDYAEISGYATRGRGFYLGLQARF